MNAKQLIENLLKLQALEFDDSERDEMAEKERERKVAELRLNIPLPVLNHYDRLRVRGKRGVAPLRNQTCSGCHVSVTKAMVMNLIHGDDIQVCENCGRYLYLSQPSQVEAPVETQTRRAKSLHRAELPCAA